MKILFKDSIKFIFGLIIGSIVCGLSVYALSINGKDISYDNTNSGLQNDNVQDVVDELYEFANASGVYYLGTGSSFNIKTLLPNIDYTKLTADNFIVEAQSYSSGNIDGWTDGGTGNWINARTTLNKSYNSTTGVFTTTFNLYAIGHLQVSSRNEYWYTPAVNKNLTTKVYLVVGTIKN